MSFNTERITLPALRAALPSREGSALNSAARQNKNGADHSAPFSYSVEREA
ncbi:hypothetical protein U91I_00164 [alpha proteobacterium U9-1i]|nr:hypothetical protein U91I_00164 [alpha proteobacterium U9-1i]